MIRETVDVRQLAERLSELLLVVADGNEVMLVQGEKPVARLLPPEQTIAERGQNADEGDADLHRGQQVRRLARQLDGRARPGVTAVGQDLQPFAPRGDDGQLGHGEDAIDQKQQEKDSDFQKDA